VQTRCRAQLLLRPSLVLAERPQDTPRLRGAAGTMSACDGALNRAGRGSHRHVANLGGTVYASTDYE
jgi:hypothetical protein